MFDLSVVAVAGKRKSFAVARYNAVHDMVAVVPEQYYVSLAERRSIARRQLNRCAPAAYERPHAVSLDAYDDLLAFGDHRLHVGEEYVVVYGDHASDVSVPNMVEYDSLAASASGRHSRW